MWTLLLSLALGADDPDTWNRADLFPTVEAWEQDVSGIPATFEPIAACEGELTKSAGSLTECLDTFFGVMQRMERAWVYASTGADENTKLADTQARRAKMLGLWGQFEETASFMAPELIAGEKKVRKFLSKSADLAQYTVFLEDTLAAAPHTLSPEGEAIMAASGAVSRSPADTYRILANADIPWPTITLSDGTEARLDSAGFTAYRAVANRDDRTTVFDAFFDTWGAYKNTLGTTLAGHVQGHIFNARQRGYASSLEAAVAGPRIPTAVYETLVAQTRQNLPTLHRYLNLRTRMLGLEDPGYQDIYVPITSADQSYELAEAKRLTLASSAPMGDEYCAIVEKGFNERWIDVYPRPGKRSGAYQTGVYGVHPYVLLNYTGDYESVSTLAHEFGHAMHTWMANYAQPYPTADYPTFMAEVASTFHEALLLDYMLENAQSDEERLGYLGAALNNLRGTYFRQAMFAEFELQMHQVAESGTPLSGAKLTEMYGELLGAYHGTEQGVMALDPRVFMEWAYIPHFYYDFYVYQYATSISASSLLAQRVIDGEDGAVDTVIELFKAGGSKPAYELLKDAGVDLATAAPYQAISDRMNAIMDEMESILDRMPSENVEEAN